MELTEVMVEELTALDESPNNFVQIFLEAFEKGDFFLFRKLIKINANSFCCNKNEVLEKFVKHSHNQSAATFISFIWETFKLWNDENLNVNIVSHVSRSTNIRTLFSLLMFDWHNPDQCEDVFYFLESKFQQYEVATKECLFSKLYKTIDANESSYRHVCLRIIYQFLDELNGRNDCKEKIFSKLEQLMKIDDVLEMRDKEFQKKILKVFVAYWYKCEANYRSTNAILIDRLLEISPFFELAFMLKEKLTSTFENKFQKYIEQCKRNHGFYYEAKLKLDNRLLLHIAEQNKLPQIRSFIFRKCPFNEINATPLTNVQEISKVLNLNIYPWTRREEDLIQTMKGALGEFVNVKAKKQHRGDSRSRLKIKPTDSEQRRDDKSIEESQETLRKQRREQKKGQEEQEKHRQEQFELIRSCITQTNSRNRCMFFGGFKTARNLLFERRFEGLSLFEEILQTAGMKEVIELLFEISDTLKNEYILQTQNPVGKHLIDYVIGSNDDMNLIGFIIPNHSNKVSLLTRRHLVKIQNRQYQQKTGISLFERFMYIRDKRLRDTFFDVPFCLLEELNEIDDIRGQTEIDRLLMFLDVKANEKRILQKSESAIHDVKHIVEVMIAGNSREAFDYEYDINKLLRYSLKYWQSTADANFKSYKRKLLLIGDPMLLMIVQIICGQVEEFKVSFYDNVKALFDRYVARYQHKDENERLIQEDMFLLFRTAIKHGRDEIVEGILDYENFETLHFEFPRHDRATQHNYFAALKLLEHGYELSREGVPPYWITEQVLRNFLDSQIVNYDENLIRINLSCLMDSHDRKIKINDKRDVSNKLLFNEHTGTLDYILKNEQIKCLLQHPVVSTYINIKTYKFQFIHRLNFFFFFFAFMLPFVFLINLHTTDSYQYSLVQDLFLLICVLSTVILGVRESVQLIWFYKIRANYFSDFDNQMELLMIALSWAVILSILTLNIQESIDIFSFVSTLLIIVSTITMMTMLPFSTVPLYMRMLRNVSVTFFKFFSFFVFIIFAFSVSFFVIFKPKNFDGNRKLTNLTREDILDDNDNMSEVYQNFGTLMGSFFKTLLMLSGELTIEPFTLSLTKMIIFFIFVITSFIVFNLIIALAITDVKELTDEAEALDLYHKSKQFIKSALKWKQFYIKFELETTNLNKLHLVKRWTVKAVRFVLYNHYYVHKLDTVFVNLQTLEVMIKVNKRYESPLSTQFGSNSKFIMASETFQRVKQIIKTRDENYFRQLQKRTHRR